MSLTLIPLQPNRFCSIAIIVGALLSGHARAQTDERTAFRTWARDAVHAMQSEATLHDLQALDAMLGDARIVALSEPVHGAAEPLEFRNRVFEHLVQERGFSAVALESGIVEGRVLNDYVVDGKGDFETVLKQGLTWTFDAFPQNRELIRWMRDYNARLPAGGRKVQFYGFDVAGSPGNLSATRGPDTALEAVLAYLRTVDPQAATSIASRVAEFLPTLKRSKYEEISQASRDSMTAAIEESISLIQHRRFQYLAKSTLSDYEWAERTALAARQVDTWWRHMPLNWKAADGYEWTRSASQTRERAMADNLDWIVARLEPRERIVIFGAVSHMAQTSFRFTDAPERDMYPFGAYAKARFGEEMVAVLTSVAGGEIAFCAATERKPYALKPPPNTSLEAAFASIGAPRYVLDLRRASPPVSDWLDRTQDHWNGFGSTRFAPAKAFDLVYFVSPVKAACAR